MTHFVIVSHTVPPRGDWGLEDLAGGAGRVDVLCRNIQAALCWSHDLRKDVQVTLVFAADPETPRAVRFDGASIRHLNPDERSTASRIRTALRHPCPDPWWEDVEPGIQLAPFALTEALADCKDILVPHVDGEPAQGFAWPAAPTLVMGDHQPLSDDELAACGATPRVAFGDKWLHGNAIIHVAHWLMDNA